MPTETHVWCSRLLQMGKQPSQLVDTKRNHRDGFDYATADRLLLFALPNVRLLCASLDRARKRARKASAAWRVSCDSAKRANYARHNDQARSLA